MICILWDTNVRAHLNLGFKFYFKPENKEKVAGLRKIKKINVIKNNSALLLSQKRMLLSLKQQGFFFKSNLHSKCYADNIIQNEKLFIETENIPSGKKKNTVTGFIFGGKCRQVDRLSYI